MALISNKVWKRNYKLVQEPYETPRLSKFDFLYESYVSLSSFVMYFHRTPVFNNSRYNLYFSFSRLFPHLGLFLMQFLFILFSRSERMKTAKSGEHEEIKGFKLGGWRQSWEWHLRIWLIEISPIRSGSLKTREDIFELKIVLFAKSFNFFLLGWNALCSYQCYARGRGDHGMRWGLWTSLHTPRGEF